MYRLYCKARKFTNYWFLVLKYWAYGWSLKDAMDVADRLTDFKEMRR